jgi:hypothetical protein
VSASVSGPEPRDGSLHASTRRIVGALAFATMLLTASFAASPAWGQDAGGAPPPEVPVAPAPPPEPADPAPPPSPPAVPDVPPVQQPSGAAVPASGEDRGGQPPGHAGSGDRISTDDLTRTPSSSTATRDPVKKPQGSVRGQDRSVVDRQGRRDRRGSAAKRRHAVDNGSRGGSPGFGSQLPSRNPSFSLHTSPGGAAAGLALAGMLAVLGAAFVLPRDRSRIFRMPTATWRPLAYVPPIELPG